MGHSIHAVLQLALRIANWTQREMFPNPVAITMVAVWPHDIGTPCQWNIEVFQPILNRRLKLPNSLQCTLRFFVVIVQDLPFVLRTCGPGYRY